MIYRVLAAALPIAVLLGAGSDTSQSDLDAIKQTALDYGMGWYEADADRMERALHADLAKRALPVSHKVHKYASTRRGSTADSLHSGS